MENQYLHKIDGLGRILLPREVREGLGWETGDILGMRKEDSKLILQLAEKRADPLCAYCGKPERVVSVNGKDICGNCLERIAEALEVEAQA